MFYFTYAGHLIPPKRIEFGRIQKNAVAGEGGGAGTRVSITGRTPEEKAVWQTLGEGNEDMVEWIVLCAALNLIDEDIVRAAGRNIERNKSVNTPRGPGPAISNGHAQGAAMRGPPPQMTGRPMSGGRPPPQMQGGVRPYAPRPMR